MSSTIVNEYRVFKSPVIVTEGLFETETIIVASYACSNNVSPASYSWGIQFIGSRERLENEYIPYIISAYKSHAVRSSMLKTGNDIRDLFIRALNDAQELTVEALHSLEFYGYSWPAELNKRGMLDTELVAFTSYLGDRIGRSIKTNEDIEKLINEAAVVSCTTLNAKTLSCLWRHDFEASENIGK